MIAHLCNSVGPLCNLLTVSPLQLSLLSEVRSLVALQDLELYDGLVLHREREALKAWHGEKGTLHPHSRCVHTEPLASHSHYNPTTLCSAKVVESLHPK